MLRAAAISSEGREIVLDVLGPGDAVGEPGQEPSACTVRAVRPSRLRAACPDEVAHLLASRARRAHATMCELAWLDSQERVYSRLHDLATRFGKPVPGGSVIPIQLTQGELGLMTGISRERVNRALRRLRAMGALSVEKRGRYVVRSPLRLVTA
jgi:CRP-like cAMP-binding protein